jgi:UDP-N-acetylmuramoyl-tripeptide--D-alanyl-D-alanine ligase
MNVVAPLWRAEDVLNAVRGRSLQEQSWSAQGIAIDSRAVQNGDLFIALQGPVNDGHDYVGKALAAGAIAAIVARHPSDAPADGSLIFVEDTFKALEALGNAGRQRAQGKIIAVTGSVGKTSTKEMLRLALSANGLTHASEGSFNNQWGVPLSLARMPQQAQFGVFELGMNHAGELSQLSPQVRPHIAMITNIEAVHLEFFNSLEAIADAKAEIFTGLEPGGSVILNRDNLFFSHLSSAARARGIKNILSFGHDSKADARLIEAAPDAMGSLLTVQLGDKRLRFKLGAPGEHLAMNAVGALLTASAAGADAEACAEALARYRQPAGRGVIDNLSSPNGHFTVIDESYNASPVSVGYAARVLGQMTPVAGGRRILVLGDMRELGESSATLHAALAAEIINAKIDLIYCCGALMKHLFDALPPAMRGGHAEDSDLLAPIVTADIRSGDIVTVKGSKSMAMMKVVAALRALATNPAHHKLAG